MAKPFRDKRSRSLSTSTPDDHQTLVGNGRRGRGLAAISLAIGPIFQFHGVVEDQFERSLSEPHSQTATVLAACPWSTTRILPYLPSLALLDAATRLHLSLPPRLQLLSLCHAVHRPCSFSLAPQLSRRLQQDKLVLRVSARVDYSNLIALRLHPPRVPFKLSVLAIPPPDSAYSSSSDVVEQWALHPSQLTWLRHASSSKLEHSSCLPKRAGNIPCQATSARDQLSFERRAGRHHGWHGNVRKYAAVHQMFDVRSRCRTVNDG